MGVSPFLCLTVTLRTSVSSVFFDVSFGAPILFRTEQELSEIAAAERIMSSMREFIYVDLQPGGLFTFNFVDPFYIGYVAHNRLQFVETVDGEGYVDC